MEEIYSKNLKKTIPLEIYETETKKGVKVRVTSNSLLKAFQQIEGVKREFPTQVIGRDYSYVRCVITLPDGRTFDNDGDSKPEYESSECDKAHTGMAASRRAFDRAFLDALDLDLDMEESRIYSSSEDIPGKNVPMHKKKSKEGAKKKKSDISIGSEENFTDPTLASPEESNSQDALLSDEIEVLESEIIPEKIEKELTVFREPSKKQPKKQIEQISFEDSKSYKLQTRCAHKGKAIADLYNEGKVKFLKNIIRYSTTDDAMRKDAPYIKVFLNGMGAM